MNAGLLARRFGLRSTTVVSNADSNPGSAPNQSFVWPKFGLFFDRVVRKNSRRSHSIRLENEEMTAIPEGISV